MLSFQVQLVILLKFLLLARRAGALILPTDFTEDPNKLPENGSFSSSSVTMSDNPNACFLISVGFGRTNTWTVDQSINIPSAPLELVYELRHVANVGPRNNPDLNSSSKTNVDHPVGTMRGYLELEKSISRWLRCGEFFTPISKRISRDRFRLAILDDTHTPTLPCFKMPDPKHCLRGRFIVHGSKAVTITPTTLGGLCRSLTKYQQNSGLENYRLERVSSRNGSIACGMIRSQNCRYAHSTRYVRARFHRIIEILLIV